MNEVQGDQGMNRTRAMYSALLNSGAISPGSVPSHLLPQVGTSPGMAGGQQPSPHHPYHLAAMAYYTSQLHANMQQPAAFSNPPNSPFIVPTSPAAPGPYFGYPHSILSAASLVNHPSSLLPHSPTSPNDHKTMASGHKTVASGHHTVASGHAIHPGVSFLPRSPSSPKELPRSEQSSAFTSSNKRKAERNGSTSDMASIMRNRLTRPPDISIRDIHHGSSSREQVPLSAPPTQTQFREMSIQNWMGLQAQSTSDLATPLSAPPIPDDEKEGRHFNYPRFSSSFAARSSEENILERPGNILERPGNILERSGNILERSGNILERSGNNEAKDFAASRTVRKSSSLGSESMDGMVTKSDEGSPSPTTSSMTPPTTSSMTSPTMVGGMNGPPNLCCYRKGSVIQLADNSLKKIEDMKTQDFLSCVASSPDLVLDASTIVEIEMRNTSSAIITFSVGRREVRSKVEVPLDHPFFVYHEGWSSCSPERARKVHNLETRLLSVGDSCITLSRRVNRDPSVNRMTSSSHPSHSESMIGHSRANGSNGHSINVQSAVNYSSDHQRNDDYSLPINLKKSNKSTEMDVDENQNMMRRSSDDEQHVVSQ